MHTKQRISFRLITACGSAALLAAFTLLLGTSHVGQARGAATLSAHFEPTAATLRADKATICGGQFLCRYMAAHNIKGDFSSHLDMDALPTVEGAQKTCLYSYKFMAEPERQYNLPVVVTLHNGALNFAQDGEPYTSDGSDPYQSQKIENKPIQVDHTHQ